MTPIRYTVIGNKTRCP